ncbi:PadR family transcriptional regulator [Microbacterium sp. XT11]|uniref:PadR family transcriptional regulator n=1 Tax=Microbacterium sp. XT11 TaxID=367477 RepID=UPI000742F3B7|nr:PadR family transcriptional regulator [Microbacterium sp. XT11]ALX67447.1 putative PadR family transcriptional regulator [Microbacterium sp. XT11]
MSTPNREPGRAERDLAALTVLALLTAGPRHPYDIHRFVVETRKDFVRGVPRSIYHAVERLAKAHLIEPVGSEQEGGRPERTVYGLTEAGRSEARRRVSMLLSAPLADRTETVAALSYLGILGRDAGIAALRARLAATDAAIAALADDLEAAAGVPEILLIEGQFELDQLRAEREWFEQLVRRLESGELAWLPAHEGR